MPNEKAYGNVFHARDKQKDSHPDAKGSFTMSEAMVEAIRNAPRDSQGRVTLEFAAWNKTGPKAGQYLSANLQVGKPQESWSNNTSPPPPKKDTEDFPF